MIADLSRRPHEPRPSTRDGVRTPARRTGADRAIPAAILVTVSLVIGTMAFAVELLVVRRQARRTIAAPAAAASNESTWTARGGPTDVVHDDEGDSRP